MKLGNFKSKKLGDKRLKRKFAILPAVMDNGDVIFLERYYSIEVYHGVFDYTYGHGEWEEEHNVKTFSELKTLLRKKSNKINTLNDLMRSLEEGVYTNIYGKNDV